MNNLDNFFLYSEKEPVEIENEELLVLYNDTPMSIGYFHTAFVGDSLTIMDGDNVLTLGVDYTLEGKDEKYSLDDGRDIYSKVRFNNMTIPSEGLTLRLSYIKVGNYSDENYFKMSYNMIRKEVSIELEGWYELGCLAPDANDVTICIEDDNPINIRQMITIELKFKYNKLVSYKILENDQYIDATLTDRVKIEPMVGGRISISLLVLNKDINNLIVMSDRMLDNDCSENIITSNIRTILVPISSKYSTKGLLKNAIEGANNLDEVNSNIQTLNDMVVLENNRNNNQDNVLATINDTLLNLQNALSIIDESIQNINIKDDTQDSTIGQNANDINSNKTSIDENFNAITIAQNQIADINTNITNILAVLTQNTDEHSDINNSIYVNSNAISDINDALSVINDSLTSLNNSINGNTTAIDTNVSEISNINDVINDHNTRIDSNLTKIDNNVNSIISLSANKSDKTHDHDSTYLKDVPTRLGTRAQNISGQDVNIIRPSGWYCGSSMPNAPTSSWFYLNYIQHINTDGFCKVIAYEYWGQSIFVKTCASNNWTGWRAI